MNNKQKELIKLSWEECHKKQNICTSYWWNFIAPIFEKYNVHGPPYNERRNSKKGKLIFKETDPLFSQMYKQLDSIYEENRIKIREIKQTKTDEV